MRLYQTLFSNSLYLTYKSYNFKDLMKLIDKFNCFLIDLDGVVYVESSPTEGSVETINYLKNIGKSVLFITNDPRSSSSDYTQKLRGMGLLVEENEVITSAMAIARHIRAHTENSDKKNAYVVGSGALKKEIELAGLTLVDGEEAKKADYVILGGHPEFHYNELKLATLALRNGAEFFATSRDPAYPSSEGHIPATGAMLASIEVASEKKAVVAGKPDKIIFEEALSHSKCPDKSNTAIIGDRLDTDILGGHLAGISTILTLSGSTKIEDVKISEIKPDYIINDLRDLLKEIDD